MDLDPGSVLSWVAIAGVLILGTRGGIWKNTIAAQKELLAGYELREEKHKEDLERVNEERKSKDAQTDAALKRLGERNQVLEELVLKRAETAEIVAVMEKHDGEAANRHKGTIRALHSILSAMEKRNATEKELLGKLTELSDHLKENPDA